MEKLKINVIKILLYTINMTRNDLKQTKYARKKCKHAQKKIDKPV